MKQFNADPRIATAVALANDVATHIQSETGQSFCTFSLDVTAHTMSDGGKLKIEMTWEAYARGPVVHGPTIDDALRAVLQPNEDELRAEIQKHEQAAREAREKLSKITGSKIAECCPSCHEPPVTEQSISCDTSEEPVRRPHEARGSAASNACFGA